MMAQEPITKTAAIMVDEMANSMPTSSDTVYEDDGTSLVISMDKIIHASDQRGFSNADSTSESVRADITGSTAGKEALQEAKTARGEGLDSASEIVRSDSTSDNAGKEAINQKTSQNEKVDSLDENRISEGVQLTKDAPQTKLVEAMEKHCEDKVVSCAGTDTETDASKIQEVNLELEDGHKENAALSTAMEVCVAFVTDQQLESDAREIAHVDAPNSVDDEHRSEQLDQAECESSGLIEEASEAINAENDSVNTDGRNKNSTMISTDDVEKLEDISCDIMNERTGITVDDASTVSHLKAKDAATSEELVLGADQKSQIIIDSVKTEMCEDTAGSILTKSTKHTETSPICNTVIGPQISVDSSRTEESKLTINTMAIGKPEEKDDSLQTEMPQGNVHGVQSEGQEGHSNSRTAEKLETGANSVTIEKEEICIGNVTNKVAGSSTDIISSQIPSIGDNVKSENKEINVESVMGKVAECSIDCGKPSVIVDNGTCEKSEISVDDVINARVGIDVDSVTGGNQTISVDNVTVDKPEVIVSATSDHQETAGISSGRPKEPQKPDDTVRMSGPGITCDEALVRESERIGMGVDKEEVSCDDERTKLGESIPGAQESLSGNVMNAQLEFTGGQVDSFKEAKPEITESSSTGKTVTEKCFGESNVTSKSGRDNAAIKEEVKVEMNGGLMTNHCNVNANILEMQGEVHVKEPEQERNEAVLLESENQVTYSIVEEEEDSIHLLDDTDEEGGKSASENTPQEVQVLGTGVEALNGITGGVATDEDRHIGRQEREPVTHSTITTDHIRDSEAMISDVMEASLKDEVISGNVEAEFESISPRDEIATGCENMKEDQVISKEEGVSEVSILPGNQDSATVAASVEDRTTCIDAVQETEVEVELPQIITDVPEIKGADSECSDPVGKSAPNESQQMINPVRDSQEEEPGVKDTDTNMVNQESEEETDAQAVKVDEEKNKTGEKQVNGETMQEKSPSSKSTEEIDVLHSKAAEQDMKDENKTDIDCDEHKQSTVMWQEQSLSGESITPAEVVTVTSTSEESSAEVGADVELTVSSGGGDDLNGTSDVIYSGDDEVGECAVSCQEDQAKRVKKDEEARQRIDDQDVDGKEVQQVEHDGDRKLEAISSKNDSANTAAGSSSKECFEINNTIIVDLNDATKEVTLSEEVSSVGVDSEEVAIMLESMEGNTDTDTNLKVGEPPPVKASVDEIPASAAGIKQLHTVTDSPLETKKETNVSTTVDSYREKNEISDNPGEKCEEDIEPYTHPLILETDIVEDTEEMGESDTKIISEETVKLQKGLDQGGDSKDTYSKDKLSDSPKEDVNPEHCGDIPAEDISVEKKLTNTITSATHDNHANGNDGEKRVEQTDLVVTAKDTEQSTSAVPEMEIEWMVMEEEVMAGSNKSETEHVMQVEKTDQMARDPADNQEEVGQRNGTEDEISGIIVETATNAAVTESQLVVMAEEQDRTSSSADEKVASEPKSQPQSTTNDNHRRAMDEQAEKRIDDNEAISKEDGDAKASVKKVIDGADPEMAEELRVASDMELLSEVLSTVELMASRVTSISPDELDERKAESRCEGSDDVADIVTKEDQPTAEQSGTVSEAKVSKGIEGEHVLTSAGKTKKTVVLDVKELGDEVKAKTKSKPGKDKREKEKVRSSSVDKAEMKRQKSIERQKSKERNEELKQRRKSMEKQKSKEAEELKQQRKSIERQKSKESKSVFSSIVDTCKSVARRASRTVPAQDLQKVADSVKGRTGGTPEDMSTSMHEDSVRCESPKASSQPEPVARVNSPELKQSAKLETTCVMQNIAKSSSNSKTVVCETNGTEAGVMLATSSDNSHILDEPSLTVAPKSDLSSKTEKHDTVTNEESTVQDISRSTAVKELAKMVETVPDTEETGTFLLVVWAQSNKLGYYYYQVCVTQPTGMVCLTIAECGQQAKTRMGKIARASSSGQAPISINGRPVTQNASLLNRTRAGVLEIPREAGAADGGGGRPNLINGSGYLSPTGRESPYPGLPTIPPSPTSSPIPSPTPSHSKFTDYPFHADYAPFAASNGTANTSSSIPIPRTNGNAHPMSDGPLHVPSSLPSSQETEVSSLRNEVMTLRREVTKYKDVIAQMQEREKSLRDRLSEQAQKHVERGGKFENLNLGENRPTEIARRYSNLYSQNRLDTLDALDELPEMAEYDDLKGKLLFSVVVLAFRSAQQTLRHLRSKIRHLLCLPDSKSMNRGDPMAKEVEEMISVYLRKKVDNYNLTNCIQEVCNQVYATLYDYPCLKACEALRVFIEECVRIAWAASVQNPPLVLDFDLKKFHPDLHTRFHSSDSDNSQIKSVLWPGLLDGEDGTCLQKGVVIT